MKELREDFLTYKKLALEKYYGFMNDMQKRAVFKMDGPLLILAGAGSGKTTVLINRIENMVRFGNAYHSDYVPQYLGDKDIALLREYAENKREATPEQLEQILHDAPVKPWSILAITFTNKAAAELKTRLAAKLGAAGEDVHASTFHSLCVRILRRDIEALGYNRNFTIYDTDDSLRVIKDALKQLNIDEKVFAPRVALTAISRAKDSMTTAKQMLDAAGEDFRQNTLARVYEAYQHTLHSSNALDFDDIIMHTVRLFKQSPDVLQYYQNRYRYIMVDEYQDTNHSQYLLISMLADKHQNLCVVGDDDQSIYKFRGATIENILSFENQFADAVVIRLEQNYRSTQNILSAANKVIANNLERKGKNLWTSSGDGDKILLLRVGDELDESRAIADRILDNIKAGAKYADHCVLYRMNAQSNSVEKAFAKNAIPYRVVGGVRFFERKEIKDTLAYLCLINNHSDSLRMLRIINEPKRGIGGATLQSAQEIANTLGIDLFEVISNSGEYAPIAKKAVVLDAFAQMIEELTEISETQSLDVLLDEVLGRTGYLKSLELQGFEGVGRIENIMELKSNILHYMKEAKEPTLSGFLEEVALFTDLDNYDTAADSVTLMTVHSAKGLEFRYVFIAGMDEGIFPGRNSMNSPAEIEEERRLAYVAITRAKQQLTIISTERRMIFGQTMYNRLSRFAREIPAELLDMRDLSVVKREQRAQTAPRRTVEPSSLKIGVGGSAPAQQGEKLQPGDRVAHKVFGQGTVLTAKPMAADMLLEVEFDSSGVKKIMANFARLTKV